MAFYEKRQKGLGHELIEEVTRTLDRIKETPQTYREVDKDIRSAQTKRFPYSILYSFLDESSLFVIAIVHQSRKPGYWINRLKDM